MHANVCFAEELRTVLYGFSGPPLNSMELGMHSQNFTMTHSPSLGNGSKLRKRFQLGSSKKLLNTISMLVLQTSDFSDFAL